MRGSAFLVHDMYISVSLCVFLHEPPNKEPRVAAGAGREGAASLSLTHEKVGEDGWAPRVLECAHVSLRMCPLACMAASHADAAAREAPSRGSGAGVQSQQGASMATTSQEPVTIHQDEPELAPPASMHVWGTAYVGLCSRPGGVTGEARVQVASCSACLRHRSFLEEVRGLPL